MREAPSLSSSIREPNDALDIVRVWAAILGSNLEDREGDGGLTAKILFWSRMLPDAMVPIVALDMLRTWLGLGSNRDARSGEGDLTVNGFSSASSNSLLEPKLLKEWVRLCGGRLSSRR